MTETRPTDDPNSTPPEGSSGPVSASGPVDGARDAETTPGAADGRTEPRETSVQPPAGGPLAVLRARLVAERDGARRSSAASRREDVGLAQSGIAAGLDIAIALLDHLPTQGTAGKPADGTLRDRYSEVIEHVTASGEDYGCTDPEHELHGSCMYQMPGEGGCPHIFAAREGERHRLRAEAAVRDDELAQARARLAQVREFAELYAGSCHVPRAETARDLLRLFDGGPTPEAGR